VLIVISASGNSPNLVEAVKFARRRGVLTIGFLGFDGGVLKSQVDDFIWLSTEKGAYGFVESGHSLLCHILTTCLMQSQMAMPCEVREVDYVDAERATGAMRLR
jgi:D-sedoheptulose 7-phosphate isomerase